jgi:lipoprotein-anchoring transpeptidase ErfK/SrfK
MARRSNRLRGRRKSQSWRYIVPVLLIVGLIIAIIYRGFGKDEDPNDMKDAAPETKMPEMEQKAPEVVKEQEMAKEPEPEPLPERLPEPIPEPIPEQISEQEPVLPAEAPKQDLPDVASIPDVAPNPEATALIEEAMTLISDEPSRIIDARTKLTEAFRMPMSRQQRSFVKDQLSALADKWLFSKTIYPDDKLCASYKVKSGDQLRTIAKQYKVPWEILLKINKIDRPEVLQAGDTIKVVNGPFHARVDRSTFIMDLYLQDKTFVRSFRIGLGKPGRDTPTGLWRVRSAGVGKLIKPPWPDPDTGKMYYAEDPDYPLGSRWIGLDGLEGNAKGRTGFGIHGTKDPDQIGKADSRGCIRMYNGDVIMVYDMFVEGISTVRVVE